ncbi:hypothetical protein [Yersinia phage vB_YenM_P778]
MSKIAAKIISRADAALKTQFVGLNLANSWFEHYEKHSNTGRFDSRAIIDRVTLAHLIVDSIANAVESWNAGMETKNYSSLDKCINGYVEANLADWSLKSFKARCAGCVTVCQDLARLEKAVSNIKSVAHTCLAKHIYSGIKIKVDTEFCLVLRVDVLKESFSETMIEVTYKFAGSETESIMFAQWDTVEICDGTQKINPRYLN